MDQKALDDIAEKLEIKYSVLDNLGPGRNAFLGTITITNKSCHMLEYGKWGIYFCHLRMMEPEHLSNSEFYIYDDQHLQIKHWNGCFFALEPVEGFKPLATGQTIKLVFRAEYYTVAKFDTFPNWYLTYEGLEPRTIKSTTGEDLAFVGDFDAKEQWKRFDYELPSGKRRLDFYDPWTPEVRFKRNEQHVGGSEPNRKLVIPTPFKMEIKSCETVDLTKQEWKIWSHDLFQNEAKFLSDKLGLSLLNCSENDAVSRHQTLMLIHRSVSSEPGVRDSEEAYKVDVDLQGIKLEAETAVGIFYACQTLLSLRGEDGRIDEVSIVDFPRGMHIDVSRNFHTKEEILAVIDLLSRYKMNKLHLHLTDDEGWRLEIPGLEELTQVGGQRGHDLDERTCLHPVLGSGPKLGELPGSGFFTVQEYREILKYAVSHHIEVIPEIDMPGHSHAAVVAMNARYERLLKEGRPESEARKYLLTHVNTNFKAQSVQMYSDNVLDPGLEATFTFMDKVIKEIKAMHEEISPLKLFHLGGDEVPYEAWLESPACQALILSKKVDNETGLMVYFMKRAAEIIHSHGLAVGVWQDGIMMKKTQMCKRSDFVNKNVVVYAWKNVWETGMASDSTKLANAGYEVVMSMATHLYFDHPYEPSPDERGLVWACRYLDTEKVFGFIPEMLYANADVKITGESFTEEELNKLSLENDSKLDKPENIIGMQGQVWCELIRTREQLQEMINPRIIALAERSWHRASWEALTDKSEMEKKRKQDWSKFAVTLGTKELFRLEKENVAYYIPRPGAIVSCTEMGRILTANCAYPGLPIFYSCDKGDTWNRYTQPVSLTKDMTSITLVTRSFNGQRSSCPVTVKISE